MWKNNFIKTFFLPGNIDLLLYFVLKVIHIFCFGWYFRIFLLFITLSPSVTFHLKLSPPGPLRFHLNSQLEKDISSHLILVSLLAKLLYAFWVFIDGYIAQLTFFYVLFICVCLVFSIYISCLVKCGTWVYSHCPGPTRHLGTVGDSSLQSLHVIPLDTLIIFGFTFKGHEQTLSVTEPRKMLLQIF